MFERFTDRARRVVVLAQEEARLLNHNYIGSEHILLGLIHEGEGVAAKALELCDVSLTEVRAQVEEIIGNGGVAPSGHIPFTPRAKTVLELSLREALLLGHNYIGTEHILLGLIREGDGVAAQVLTALGLELSYVRTVVVGLLEGDDPEPLARPVPGRARPAGELAPMPRRVSAPRPATCSFCGTPSPQARPLFAGRDGVLICERCARSIVEQAGSRTAPLGTPATAPELEALVASVVPAGAPPADEDAAREEIERVFVAWRERSEDGRGLVNVQDGADLGPYLDDVARRHGMAERSALSVDAVVFVSPTEAVVWSTISLDGEPVAPLQHREGRAFLVDGRWLIEREMVSQLLAFAGVRIPPSAEYPPGATG